MDGVAGTGGTKGGAEKGAGIYSKKIMSQKDLSTNSFLADLVELYQFLKSIEGSGPSTPLPYALVTEASNMAALASFLPKTFLAKATFGEAFLGRSFPSLSFST